MTIQDLKDNNLIIFEGIVGSQAYGISTPNSDIDIKGVFILPLDSILSFGYIEQVNDEKHDITYYEIQRFLQLLSTGNPNILELLNLPVECILYKDPLFNYILDHKDKFITKKCKDSFSGYAITQIRKARGLNKKIVTPMEKERKTPLDFCYRITDKGSEPFSIFLEDMAKYHNKTPQEISNDIGLVNIPHARDLYHVHWMPNSDYRGIINEDLTSNELRLSSVPKESVPWCILSYNKDGYTSYCKDYREYWEWVEKRNPNRYTENMSHNKGYDGKNMAHCHRLLDMAIEIGSGKGIIVKRENREQLLLIRSGQYDYDLLVTEAEDKIKMLDEVYEQANLPADIDFQFINELLLNIRLLRYAK